MTWNSRKKPRLKEGGLYDFLPQPDPARDAAALLAAGRKESPALPQEDRTRVIFLDIDGVLTPAGSTNMIVVDGDLVAAVTTSCSEGECFNTVALRNLRAIIQQTGAALVLSSEWRRTDARKDLIGITLRAHGLPQLRDSTTTAVKVRPELLKGDNAIAWCERRAREIGEWLQRHPEIVSWVVVDDVDFSWADGVRAKGTPLVKCRSVRSHAVRCLSEDDVKEAVRILLNPPVLTPQEEVRLERRAARRTKAAMDAAKIADKERQKRPVHA